MNLPDQVILYHGSYADVRVPDLSKCRSGKDFGKGFYLTTDKAQAKRFMKTSVQKARNDGALPFGATYGFVSSFRFSTDDALQIFLFQEADAAWLHCVVAHRRRNTFPRERSKWKDYDILGGKIANDHTNLVITSYIDGTYGSIPSEQADAIAISFLEPEKLKDQFCFRTKKALRHLTHIKTERFAL